MNASQRQQLTEDRAPSSARSIGPGVEGVPALESSCRANACQKGTGCVQVVTGCGQALRRGAVA